MLPMAGRRPRGRQWVFQPKWDGVRATVRVGGDGQLTLRSRSGRVITAQLPELAGLPDAVDRPLLLDGELVVIGRDGRVLFFSWAQDDDFTLIALNFGDVEQVVPFSFPHGGRYRGGTPWPRPRGCPSRSEHLAARDQ